MNSELYNVDKYTDAQLYDILDMNSPTDRELEAKILHLIHKYSSMQTESGNQLSKFFDDIYKRFFSSEEDAGVEGFDNEKKDNKDLQQENIMAIQSFDYAQDKLQINPLIKQTITRVISIDSQYRDVTVSPSTTNFSFDLSEPLRDVVSLKLYSIQIPYTWYTISKSYGSNFFYLKGISQGITYSDHSYKIEINPGTYTPTQLISAVNSAFEDVSNNAASDVNFNGQPLLTYNNNTSKTTVNLNLQNIFNENYYTLQFPSVSTDSIAQYLGFKQQTYSPNAILSNETVYTTDVLNSQNAQSYSLDNSNNNFQVIQYIGETPFSGYDGNSKVLNNITVTLLDSKNDPFIGNASRQDIINAIYRGLQSSSYFDPSSNIQRVDSLNTSLNVSYSHYKLTIVWNRYKIKYVPNAKTVILFPNEPDIPLPNQYPPETFSIWKYNRNATYNAFFFDNSLNLFSQIISETPYENSSFIIDTSTNMFFTCTTPGYNQNQLNDFSLNVASGTYSSVGFASAISNSFSVNNSRVGNVFNINNTTATIDSTNRFNLSIDMNTIFTNSDYKIVFEPNSILLESNKNNDSQNYDASFSTPNMAGNTITGNISYNTVNNGYLVDNSYILTVVPISNNKYAGNIHICLPNWTDQTSFIKYNGIDDFITNGIQSAITNTTVSIPSINDVQTPFRGTTLSRSANLNPTTGRYDISLNMQCYYYLTEANYDISFSDGNASFINSQWSKLKIDSKYNLYNEESGAYAIITGNSSIASNSINVIDGSNTIIIQTQSNTIAPDDIITLTIPPKIYIISELFAAINTAFTNNDRTYGSSITSYVDANNNSYSKLWINVNNVYTTQDYMLVFYDPISFITCFSGSTSVQNTTWDTTVGWILGFRDYTQYFLTKANQVQNSNFKDVYYYLTSTNGSYIYVPGYQPGSTTNQISTSIQLTGDTTLSTNLFNYFLISLDDYIQNHLNDGLVTITRSQTAIQTPGYKYNTNQTCDPATNTLVTTTMTQQDSNNVTNALLYSLNQSAQSQQPKIKPYSAGPFVKDLFGIIPVKAPSNTGDIYTEFGGSLQNQSRMYFGPVNIRKMSIQLLNDRGDMVDLNGSNWTFSFVCEQLYRSSSAGT
jgi:hypothetical protein